MPKREDKAVRPEGNGQGERGGGTARVVSEKAPRPDATAKAPQSEPPAQAKGQPTAPADVPAPVPAEDRTAPAAPEPAAPGSAEASPLAVALGDTAEITALDPAEGDPVGAVANPDFPVVLRGYDRHAVNAYVAEVAQLVAELHATRSPRAAVKKALDRVGRETAAVLQRAQEAADEITADSRSRADERLRESEREAERIVADAHERVRRLDADTEALWRERRKLVEDVRLTAERLRAAAEEAIARFPAEGEEPDAAAAKAPGRPGAGPAPADGGARGASPARPEGAAPESAAVPPKGAAGPPTEPLPPAD